MEGDVNENYNKYMTIKVRIERYLQNKNKKHNLEIIEDAVTRVQTIISHTYSFLKIFIISTNQTFENNFLEINKDVVLMAMRLFIIETKNGSKPSEKNQKIFDFFKQIYNEHYKKLWNEEKIDGKNLSGILIYAITEIVTSINNNIKNHFVNYVNRYVNCCFKKEHDKILENLSGKDKDIKKNSLKTELRHLKDDIIHLTHTRDAKYNSWFDENIQNIVPILNKNYKKTHIHYINSNPQTYIKNMYFMSNEIIKMDYKPFNFFPSQKSNKPRHIYIDTKTIIDLFLKGKLEQPKNVYFQNIHKYSFELWNKVFKISNKKFKPKSHNFDYMISTDGLSMSIRFIHHSFVDENNKKKENFKKGRINAREEYKNLDRNEIEIRKNEKEEKNKNFKKTKNELKKEGKENFKQLNDEEKEEIKKKMKKNVEFPYLEELSEEELEIIKKMNEDGYVIYVDPGKKNLLFMMNKFGKYFRYTIQERMYETKRIKYRKSLVKYKKNEGIEEIEKELGKYNSKETNLEKLKEYIKKKNEINKELINKYKDEKFRKYKWFQHINAQRSEDNLVNKIKKKFGNKLILIYGNWSIPKQMRNFISTPNIRLKRKLGKHFKIYSIDEYNTSKINYITKMTNENLYLEKIKINTNEKKNEKTTVRKIIEGIDEKMTVRKLIEGMAEKITVRKIIKGIDEKITVRKLMEGIDEKMLIKKLTEGIDEKTTVRKLIEGINEKINKKITVRKLIEGIENGKTCVLKEMKKMHSILTYKLENGRMGCINRDKNSVNNMKIITETYLETKERPKIYCRPNKKEQQTQEGDSKITNKEKPKRKAYSKNPKSCVKLVDEPVEVFYGKSK